MTVLSTALKRTPTPLLVVATMAAAVASAWIVVSAARPHLYSGTVLQADGPAPSMDGVVLSDGSPLDLAEYTDELLLVYFGYTHCPDACPATLAMVDRAFDRLGTDDRDRTNLVMVGIDPERDDAEMLDRYVSFFNEEFVAATGEPDDLVGVASSYGVYFAKTSTDTIGYTVDHTTTLMGIDTRGRLRIIWGPEVTADQLADDIKELL